MTVLAQEPVPDDLLPFGWVDCGVIDVVGDDTSDDDQDPGSVPVVGDGLIVFIPKITEMRVMRNGRSTLVRNRPVPANLDQDGVIELAGHRLVKLWHGVWTCTPGNRNILDFDQFDFELTGSYTLASPAPLWHLAPYDPPDGVTVTTLVVPAGAATGQILAWDGKELVWTDAGSGGGGEPGEPGHSPVLTWQGDQIAVDGVVSGPHLTGPAGDPGDDGVTPANPQFTASASTLAAGSQATASVSGTYPALTLALGIPRGADGSSGSGGGTSTQIVAAGRPDVAASMTTSVQAQVAAAPVGATFVSTDGPQGAWAWRRRTSGWQVVDGDTRWRDISSLITSNFTGGKWRIKRALSTVTINATGLTMASATFANNFLSLPSGLCGPGVRTGITTVFNDTTIYGAAWAYNSSNAIEGNFPGANGAFLMTFDTDSAWPTTLPGTPAA